MVDEKNQFTIKLVGIKVDFKYQENISFNETISDLSVAVFWSAFKRPSVE